MDCWKWQKTTRCASLMEDVSAVLKNLWRRAEKLVEIDFDLPQLAIEA